MKLSAWKQVTGRLPAGQLSDIGPENGVETTEPIIYNFLLNLIHYVEKDRRIQGQSRSD